MKHSITVVLALSAVMLFSCKSSYEPSVREIVLGGKVEESPQMTAGYTVRPIALKADGRRESLLGAVTRLYPADDRYFVLSSEGVSIFDGQGNFVKRLQQGRGPEEFVFSRAITVDQDRKTLEVLSAMDFTVYRYDYSGNFVDKQTLPKGNYLDFCKVDQGYLLYTPVRSRANPDSGSFVLLNDDGTALQIGKKFPGAPVFDLGSSVFSRCEDALYFKGVWGDELFRIHDGKPAEVSLRFSGAFNDTDSAFESVDAVLQQAPVVGGVRMLPGDRLGMTLMHNTELPCPEYIYSLREKKTYRHPFWGTLGLRYLTSMEGKEYFAVLPALNITSLPESLRNQVRDALFSTDNPVLLEVLFQ